MFIETRTHTNKVVKKCHVVDLGLFFALLWLFVVQTWQVELSVSKREL